MPRTITLLELRTDLRALTGFENVPDPSDTFLNRVLNDAIAETWDLLIQKWDDLYTTSSDVNVTIGTGSVPLPTTFFKLRKVECQSGARWVRCLPFDLSVSHNFRSVTGKRYRYRLQGNNLMLSVPTTGAETFRVWFIPYSPRLTADADTFDGVNGFESLALQMARRDVYDRFDMPIDSPLQKIEKLTARIRTAADGRDATEPFSLNPYGPRDEDRDEELDD
jgi:hypothetical protein